MLPQIPQQRGSPTRLWGASDGIDHLPRRGVTRTGDTPARRDNGGGAGGGGGGKESFRGQNRGGVLKLAAKMRELGCFSICHFHPSQSVR
jgi:hypothetical protein